MPGSYCLMACCLAHHREIYVTLHDRSYEIGRTWVHADGWACDSTPPLAEPQEVLPD